MLVETVLSMLTLVCHLTCIPHIVVRVGAAVCVNTYPLAMLTFIGGYF
jgi:hypothetical protein